MYYIHTHGLNYFTTIFYWKIYKKYLLWSYNYELYDVKQLKTEDDKDPTTKV